MKKTMSKKIMASAIVASAVVPGIALLSTTETAHASESIIVTEDSSAKKTIETSQLRVWMQSSGRYGLQLKSNGATIFYGNDSAYIYILRGGSFPTGLPSNFYNLTVKSFVVNGTTIEQTRTDGTFDYIFRLSMVNATSQGAYMKAELEMKNLTGYPQNVGASFNIDTKVNGNDASPFRIIPNGWEAFNNGVQVTAYYQDVFNVTNADSIYLGHYSQQYPMPVSSFYDGQVIYPGDSGAGFYYNLKSVAPYASRKESWIMGMGPRNANPVFSLTAPGDDQVFYRGQTLQISGTAQDTDIGDKLDVKWAIDGGAENILSSFTANGNNQSFNKNYTLPSNLTEGWHTLQVWAMDDKGGVSSSNTKRFYINNFVTPAPPAYSNVETDAFTVSFDKKGNVNTTTYELYRQNNNTTVNMGVTDSMVERGLSPNTRHEYKVRAKNTTNDYTEYSPVTAIYTLAMQPTAGNLDDSTTGQVTFSWNANGNPSGTKYQYEIRKESDNSVVKSGETTSNTANVTSLPTDVRYKVYVKAINGDNKPTKETFIGDVLQDTINPNLTLSQNISNWTSETVTLIAEATDSGKGVRRIQLPNGNWVANSTVNYVVNSNGDYTFKVEDLAGNVTTKTITVSNIDKENPNAIHSIEHVNGDTYNVLLQASDSASGMKQIKLPNGQLSTGASASYAVKKGETYEFELEDRAGNKTIYKITANVPELSVYQKETYVKAEWNIDTLATGEESVESQLYRGNNKIYGGRLAEFEDREATDKTKPNSVTKIQVNTQSGEVFMRMEQPTDNGTNYDYIVKGVTPRGNIIASEKKTATVTTGIDGYSYVVDTNPNTIPDDAIDTRTTTVPVPISSNAKYYVHIKVIDKAGNVSDVSHLSFQDNIAPTLELTQNPTTWTNDSVVITAVGSDEGLGVKRIQLPDNTWVEGALATYTVNSNGVYTFIVEDMVGNQTVKTITITNIDKTPPTPPLVVTNQDWTKNQPISVTITGGTDSQSGVKEIQYRLEGATNKDWETYKSPFSVSNEGETKVLARTVDNLGQVSINANAFVRIDITAPHNTGITIQLKK